MKIDTNIPLPQRYRSDVTGALAKLEPGHSVLIPLAHQARVTGASVTLGINCVTRRERQADGRIMVRVWRAEDKA